MANDAKTGRFEELLATLEAMPLEERESPEGLTMLAEAWDVAPPEFLILAEQKLREMLPAVPDCVDDLGTPFYSVEQLATAFGQPVEEVRNRCQKLTGIRPQIFTPVGSFHRVN